jgi:hypothetical protein
MATRPARETAAAKPPQAAAAASAPKPTPSAEPKTPTAAPKLKRKSPQQERFDRIRQANAIPTVRVTPASDDLRRLLKHPSGMGFRSAGSAEWPHDKFTKRRLAEGSVKLAESREQRPR